MEQSMPAVESVPAMDQGTGEAESPDQETWLQSNEPAVGYTCLYGDVDGSVEVPCDSDVCMQVGCLRSDGVYIGPAADEMNSANAPDPEASPSAAP
jgi:hypothetical protein